MIQFDSTWWLPDGEAHLQEWMTITGDRKDGRYRYQGRKYDAALKYCRQRRTAVDAGAHVGLFSFWMAKDFASVLAFEPHPDHRDCWRKNMDGIANAELFPYALGPEMASISLKTGPSSSGDTYVDTTRTDGVIPQWPLDRFNVRDLDFLKIDAEGYEVFILQGAKETLKRNRPVILVEQKPGHGEKYGIADTTGVDLLRSWGYALRKELHGDYILTPAEWGD